MITAIATAGIVLVLIAAVAVFMAFPPRTELEQQTRRDARLFSDPHRFDQEQDR